MTRRALIAMVTCLAVTAGAALVGAVTSTTSTLALPGPAESTVVAVTPTRVLDTRVNVGLAGRVVASGSSKLQITGEIETYVEATMTRPRSTVVPTGATGVLLNVTAVNASAKGFVSIRPGNASGNPSTSSLNFGAGSVVPNAVTVAVPTVGTGSGQIDIAYRAAPSSSTVHLVIDVVGYTTSSGLADLASRVVSLEAQVGTPGPLIPDPARVVWVAESGGDFTSLSAAMAATTGPAVIRIAPGTYTETAPVTVKNGVDVQGSGRDITIVRCACAGTAGPTTESPDGAVLFKPTSVSSTISHLTIDNFSNTTGSAYGIKLFGTKRVHDVAAFALGANAYGILASGFGAGSAYSSITDVLVDVSFQQASPANLYGIYNIDSDTSIADSEVFVNGEQSVIAYGVYNLRSDVELRGLDVEASGQNSSSAYGVYSIDSNPLVIDGTILAEVTSASLRAAAIYTSQSVAGVEPGTTVRDSILAARTTSGPSFGAFATGNEAYTDIAGSDLSGGQSSVFGRAFIESSTVHNNTGTGVQVCFNVRLDTGTPAPSYTTLDAACD